MTVQHGRIIMMEHQSDLGLESLRRRRHWDLLTTRSIIRILIEVILAPCPVESVSLAFEFRRRLGRLAKYYDGTA